MEDEPGACGSVSTSALAGSVIRPRRASWRSPRAWRSTPVPPTARWIPRRCCSRPTPSSAQSYIAAMELAGSTPTPAATSWWQGARDPRRDAADEVHNHHNFAWREEHLAAATGYPQGLHAGSPGQQGFVGGSMGDPSVILEGVESDEASQSLPDRARRRPGDEPHAGRGSGAPTKRWACRNRDCDRVFRVGSGRCDAGARARTIPSGPDEVWIGST